MLLTNENRKIILIADAYILEFLADRPFVTVKEKRGAKLAVLFALSGVNRLGAKDDTTGLSPWAVEEGLDEIVISLEASSAAWESKTVRFRCTPRSFRYELDVRGSGRLDTVDYFGGYCSALVRWGSGFFWSGHYFNGIFNPEPNADEHVTIPASGSTSINLTGVPLPGRADWFFTPPPFCLSAELAGDGPSRWMSFGVEAEPGANRFTEYAYHGREDAFFLSLAYEGHTGVDGSYSLPSITFDFGPDPYTLLASHVQHLRNRGMAPTPAAIPRPAWWTEPLFCGWGAQCYLANMDERGRAPAYATQANYEAFLAALGEQGLFPGTVVLDDRWQAAYGVNEVDPLKWPDLPGFIRERHDQGQRVLLWLKAWDPEGLPAEECITNAAGLPIAVDPTNPAAERRLRESIRRMLSADGYDADGFKIDFSARIPSGPGMRAWGDAWGLELMRLYLGIIYDEAHRVKPDALVITHTPHPYLADLVDAIRLNDINLDYDVVTQMTHRARVAAIACPEALIDTDNWPIRDLASWRAYLAQTPRLGIPALYYATHIDATGEALTPDDYALLRTTWAGYRAAATAQHAGPAEEKISSLGGSFLPGANRLVKKLALSFNLPSTTKPLKAWEREVSRSSEA